MVNWKPPLSYLQRFLHKPQLDNTVLTLIFHRVEYTQHTCTNTPRPACWCSPHPTWPGSDNQDFTFKLTPLNPVSTTTIGYQPKPQQPHDSKICKTARILVMSLYLSVMPSALWPCHENLTFLDFSVNIAISWQKLLIDPSICTNPPATD